MVIPASKNPHFILLIVHTLTHGIKQILIGSKQDYCLCLIDYNTSGLKM